MRHDHLKQHRDYDIVDVAAVWPRAAALVQAPVAEIESRLPTASTPAVPDMPPAIGKLIVAVYVGIIAAFALTMARGGQAAFAIAISGFYVAIFLAVPRIFLKVENDRSRRPSLSRFLQEGMKTATGHISGGGALVQILIVPVLLLIGLGTMGLFGLWMLP